MRQMVSMLLLVIVIVNLIANLPEVTSLISQAVFTIHYPHDNLADEAVNLDLDAPNIAGEITLVAAIKTSAPLCATDMQTTSGWPSSQPPVIGIGDKDVISLDYGLMVPDDPPRYKLNRPDYDQLNVVLWARDAASQPWVLDAPGYICTKPAPVHKVEQDSC